MTHKVTPKVSVSITTFNQRSFIRQTLDGVIAQRTNFPVEILVGEDGSSDGTRDIVRDYAEHHPELIRPFYNTRENVIYINGKATARWNFMNNVRHARGQYLALLEGDDYWTDPLKLQKQVDALDEAPDCSFSFHRAGVLDEDKDEIVSEMPDQSLERLISLEDIMSGFFIPTCSVILRRNLIGEFPDWYAQIPAGDWPLYILCALNGPALYLEENMSVYRVHQASYWASRSGNEQRAASLETMQIMRDHLDAEHHAVIDENIHRISRQIFHQSIRNKQPREAVQSFVQLLSNRGDHSVADVFWSSFKKAFSRWN